MRAVVLALLAGCPPPRPLVADVPDARPSLVRHYTIWLGGARIGAAVETETWTGDRLALVRDERLAFLRGEARVALHTSIAIDADAALAARRVAWREHGADSRMAEATRASTDATWQLSTGGVLPAAAVPAELVPLLVRRDGAFSGVVFLPARGFVAGTGRVEPIDPNRLAARFALDAGPVAEASIDLHSDRTPARVVDGDGVIALRASASAAAAPFTPVDLIAATAIPISGTRRAPRLVLDGDLSPPALPGQRVDAQRVELAPTLPGALDPGPRHADRTGDIRALVTAVRERITPDLAATSRDAAATAGDCTTFALAYAAAATRAGIPTRVVTGYRVDADLLVRHRWAISWTGARWIAIDAAYGAAPAGGNLLGLAAHDADDAGLLTGEAALARVRGATWE